ncbi:MAG: ATP synthase F0 subunit A [Bacteroidia bacterium]|nr:ATP synthase F0 subunit A [Bacteroidia bacterium]
MKRLYNILVCILILSFSCSVTYASESIQSDSITTEKDSTKSLDISSILFGHTGDSYEYHITEIHEHPIVIPLPVIVYSEERGWFTFLSTKVTEGETYNGFFIQKGGSYDGKIVEINSKGEIARPFDLSITKNVFALLFSCFLLIIIFVPMARSYKKRPLDVPNKSQNLLEMVIMYMEDDVIKPSVGKKYQKYSPYLLTVFFFILINNLMGLIPIFPFGANLTGNLSVTLILALFTFFITNIFGTKEYWKEILWPDVPVMLKAPIPLMQMIELISTLTKPFALMIRLFANIFAGHMIILVLTTLIFLFSAIMGAAMGYATVVISVLFSVFMYCLELLVAFIQAYVFTLLSAIFIGLAQVEPHHKTKKEESFSVAQVNKKND